MPEHPEGAREAPQGLQQGPRKQQADRGPQGRGREVLGLLRHARVPNVRDEVQGLDKDEKKGKKKNAPLVLVVSFRSLLLCSSDSYLKIYPFFSSFFKIILSIR